MEGTLYDTNFMHDKELSCTHTTQSANYIYPKYYKKCTNEDVRLIYNTYSMALATDTTEWAHWVRRDPLVSVEKLCHTTNISCM